METDAISRSAVINALQELADKETAGEAISDIGFGLSMAIGRLISAPALDVQPVVRCKDCKWYDSAFYACSKCGVCVNRDFYCADGARMDEEENEE